MQFPWTTAATILVLMLISAALASLVPALRMGRMHIAEAIGQERNRMGSLGRTGGARVAGPLFRVPEDGHQNGCECPSAVVFLAVKLVAAGTHVCLRK